jgi:hypothetical protein
MEGMSIAVLASHQGYQNIDVDIRDRMAKIYAETAKHYGEHPGHRPYGDDPYSKYDGGGAQAPGGDRGTDGSQEQGAGGDSGGRGGQAYPPGKAQPPAGDTGRGGDAGGAI